jgi:hypothetical protein
MTPMTNRSGLWRTLDEIFGEVSSAKLRCPECNGMARIEPESSPFDNRGKKVLRCWDCDYEGDWKKLKSLR